MDINKFSKNKNCKDGYENKCKSCRLEERKKFINTCEYCGKKFRTAHKNSKYCSNACKPQCRPKKVKVVCFICGKEKEITSSQMKRSKHHYCSTECKNKGYSILYSGENSARYAQLEVQCDFCGKTFKRHPHEIEKYANNYCSKECSIKGYSILYSGENHPCYDPNKSEEDRIINRNIEGYEEWIKQVYKKDNYTCQCCGDNKGGNLNAHHIFNYMEYPDLRVSVDNGITLCEDCHKLFHSTYGYKGNNKQQLDRFLNENRRAS